MNFTWSSKEDEILINFVRVNDIFYNVKNKNYRQKQIKDNLWSEVGKVLNKTGSDCHKRWCYVRDYYIRRKGKPGTGSCGEAAKKRADLLSFLDKFPVSQGNNISFIEVDNLGTNTQEVNEIIPLQIVKTEDMTFNNDGDSSTDNSTRDSNSVDDNYREYKSDDNNRNLKRKNNSNAQEHLLEQIDQRIPNRSSINELDETDLFFSSMAKIVKKLPRYEQVQLRIQIGSLVGDAELRYIATSNQ